MFMRFVLFFIFLFSVDLFSAYELRLHYNRAYLYNNTLYVDLYTSKNIELNYNIKKYLDNGVIVSLNFRVNLVKKNFLLDDTIKDVYFYRQIYYDFFTKEYVLINSDTMREVRDSNFYSLMSHIYFINRVEVLSISNINPSSSYYFKTRLSIQFYNVYSYLSVFFSLITPLQYRIKWLHSPDFNLNSIIL